MRFKIFSPKITVDLTELKRKYANTRFFRQKNLTERKIDSISSRDIISFFGFSGLNRSISLREGSDCTSLD